MMGKIKFLVMVAILMEASSCHKKSDSFVVQQSVEKRQATGEGQLQNGDLIFQTSLSSQSQAIQIATKSMYSHCGIVFLEEGKPFVFEAGDRVQRTPLNEWIARGQDKHFVVKRLKNAEAILTDAVLKKMQYIGQDWQGKQYDWAFNWTNDKIYCSELVWKMYQKSCGLELGNLKTLKDFDLSHPEVQKKLKERYGTSIPMDEPVITPQDVFESELLETVSSNG